MTLQDFAYPQDPLLVGLIVTLLGGALQESLGPLTRHLVELGRRELETQRRGVPGSEPAVPTTHST